MESSVGILMELLEQMEVNGKGGIEAMVNVPGDKDDDPGHRFRFKPLLDRPVVEVMEDVAPEIEGNTSLDFLQAIYRSADQPMQRRMRAAIAALPHEHPKFAVISQPGSGRDFAAQLEAARKRSGRPVVIEHQPQAAACPALQKVE
jgi:hypothetical protein